MFKKMYSTSPWLQAEMELSIYTAMIFLSENSWVIVNVYEAI